MENIIRKIITDEIINIEKLGNSFSSNVYLVFTSSEKYIFKILKSNEKRIKESEALQFLYKHIRVPKLIKTGTYNDTNYIIMEYIEGLCYLDKDSYKLTTNELIGIGNLLKKLHNINPLVKKDNWYEYLKHKIESTYKTLDNILDNNDKIYNILIEKLESLIKNNYTKSLIHMDFRPGNIVINNDIYLIDFESIGTGDPIFDLTKIRRLLSKKQFNVLINSYINNKSKDFDKKIEFYNLFDSYTTLEWCINNNQVNSEYYNLNLKEVKKYEKR